MESRYSVYYLQVLNIVKKQDIMIKTEREFRYSKFIDLYGEICSIQKSSVATDVAIWLGIDRPKLTIFENVEMGKCLVTEIPENWMVNSRMHLSREQVAELLPILQKFVETGDL